MNLNIHVGSNNTFRNNSSVVGTINENPLPASDPDAILEELREIRGKLESAQTLSLAIEALESAIKEQNKPKISRVIGDLSKSFSSSLLSSLASESLLTFLKSF